MDPQLAYPLDKLGMSTRLYNCLHGRGYRTVGDLVTEDPNHFLAIRNFGTACMSELQDLLSDLKVGGIVATPFGSIMWKRLDSHPFLQHFSPEQRWKLYCDLTE